MNPIVNQFLEEHQHPLRPEIDYLRTLILASHTQIIENIKWNGPNYVINNEDRLTIKIFPPSKIQVIFHCGAKVKSIPNQKLIKDEKQILTWKTNDRAFATFYNLEDIKHIEHDFKALVKAWLEVIL